MSRRHRVRGKRRPRPSVPALAGDAVSPLALDRLAPEAPVDGEAAGLRQPPDLVVEAPDRVAARKARDVRDGVKPPDRRGLLYLAIAVFVAIVVFAILNLIESRGPTP
jgi:hypothetical protein